MFFNRIRRGMVTGVLAVCATMFATSAISQTSGSIIDELKDQGGRFSILLDALEAAGLTDSLDDPTRRVTLFAPNNDAFLALGADLPAVLQDPALLKSVLNYHTVDDRLSEGTICDNAIAAGGSYTVVASDGQTLTVSCDAPTRTLLINDSQVIPPEYIVGPNKQGFIHEIDTILFPAQPNVAPVAADDTFGPFPAGTSGSVSVLDNDDDTDGELVPGSIIIVSAPANGTAEPQPNGTVIYTHNGNPGTGSDTFQYTVTDNDGAVSNVATVTISPIEDATPNVPPVAVNDFVSAPANGPQPLGVLANDTDTDGTIDPSTLVLLNQPAYGSAVVENGDIIYTHDPASGRNFDIVLYRVSDDDGAPSNLAYALITVIPGNVPPVANDDTAGPVAPATPLPINVAGNDTDSDGDVIAGTIAIVSGPSNGVANVVGGEIVYAANPGTTATSDTLTYTIQDDDGATSNPATVTIAIEEGNVPPVAVDDAFEIVQPGSKPDLLDVLGNDSDTDGSVDTDTIRIVSGPAGGVAQPSNGQVLYVPNPGTTSDSFVYVVLDDDGAESNPATVTITVTQANIPPVAVDDAAGPITAGESVVINVVDNDSDTDGTVDPSTVTIISAPSFGTATPQADGTVVYQHNGTTGAGTDSFTYTILDNEGLVSNIATVTISPIVDPVAPHIVDRLISEGNYNILLGLLFATDLIDPLSNENEVYTLFAPADDVFEALGQDTLDALLADPEGTRELLLYHVINGSAQDRDTLCATNGAPIETASGATLTVNCTDIDTFVNTSEVVVPNLTASNGIIHGIAPVLQLPVVGPDKNLFEVVRDDDELSTLEDLLVSAGLDSVLADLGNTYTLFAPNNAAFGKLDPATIAALQANPDLLSSVLQYHVLVGQALSAADLLGRDGQTEITVNGETVSISVTEGNLFINDSLVVRADLLATNGVAHTIDTVLLPPGLVIGGNTLLDIIKNDDRFDKLLKALQLTGLDAELANSNKVYTAFLPTDDAWHRLGSWKLSWLFKDNKYSRSYLKKILLNHLVVGQRYDLNTLIQKRKVVTNKYKYVYIRSYKGRTYIGHGQVKQADVTATNGIAHVISYPIL